MGNSASRAVKPAQAATAFGYRDVRKEHAREPIIPQGAVPEYVVGTLFRQCGGAFVKGTNLLDGLAHVAAWHLNSPSSEFSFSNRFLETRHHQAYVDSEGSVRNWVFVGKSNSQSVDVGAYENHNVNFLRMSDGLASASPENPMSQLVVLGDQLETMPPLRQMVPGSDNIRSDSGLVFLASHNFEEPTTRSDLHAGVYLRMASHTRYGCIPSFESGYVVYRAKERHALPLDKIYEQPLAAFGYLQRASVPLLQRVPYMHSMLETKSYVVLIVSSKRMAYDQALNAFPHGFFAGFPFERDAPLSFEVLQKHLDGHLTHAATCVVEGAREAAHIFHSINVYDAEDGTIVADVTWANGDDFDGGASVTSRGLCRFIISPHAQRATRMMLSSEVHEFAHCSPKVLQRPHRYVWGLRFPQRELNAESVDALTPNDVVKVDTASGEIVTWALHGYSASEPQMVPHPGDRAAEDEGVLLIPANEIAQERSWLLVLDARNLRELARLPAPIEVNTGLHNLFVPEQHAFLIKP
jgi:hypothetical protein